ncbi:MAG: hypothetical protein HY934_00815 [Candidatus Firestonebacteria bacterium]|nr:hypothetical protein [Candidatus Firestonebacteria bacterium]
MKFIFWRIIICLIFLLYFENIYARNNFSLLPVAECGISKIGEIEKNIKGLPHQTLTKEELIKRNRISIKGEMLRDKLYDTTSFWNIIGSKWQKTPATCRVVTDDVYIYVANDVWYNESSNEGYLTEGDLNTIADRFINDSSSIYKLTREIFGEEVKTGLDKDNHLTIFLLDLDNDLALGNTTWISKTWLGGYSTLMDDYKDGTGFIHSNERKIIYIDTYPTFEHGKVFFDFESSSVKIKNPAPTINHNDDEEGIYFPEGPISIYSVLAHEFQHKIHSYYDPYEELWLNEGCSELAGLLNNPGIKNLGTQLSHLRYFLENSNDNLLKWDGKSKDYGGTMLFFTYLYDHFGGNIFIKSIVEDIEQGSNSIQNNLVNNGYSDTFYGIFNNWVVSNYFSDTTNPVYGYKSINLFDTAIFKTTPEDPKILRYGMNPQKVYKLETPMEINENKVMGHAGVYYSFTPAYNTTNVNINFKGEENDNKWESRVGIKKTDGSLILKYLPVALDSTGSVTIRGFSSTQVSELVLIAINQGDEDKKFSFTVSLSSHDGPFSPKELISYGQISKIDLEWNGNKNISLNTNKDIEYESTFVDDSTYVIRYFIGYNVYRSSDNQNYTKINSGSVKEEKYTDESVTPKIKYYYKVSALLYKFEIVNNKIFNKELFESNMSLETSAKAFPPLSIKARSKCFISDNIFKRNKILKGYNKEILDIKDKYLLHVPISKKIVDLYYNHSPGLLYYFAQ